MNAQRRKVDDGNMSIRTVFEIIADTAANRQGDMVSVGEILDAFGSRAFGPLLFIIGVLMITPLGAIPGAPLFATALVFLLMAQSVFRSGAPWIPSRMRNAELGAEKLRSALGKLEPWFKRVDAITRPRMTSLLTPVMETLLAVCCMLIALTMIPLGFVPFAVTLPALALAVIGLGWMTSDGVFVIAGMAVAGIGLALALYVAAGQ